MKFSVPECSSCPTGSGVLVSLHVSLFVALVSDVPELPSNRESSVSMAILSLASLSIRLPIVTKGIVIINLFFRNQTKSPFHIITKLLWHGSNFLLVLTLTISRKDLSTNIASCS